MDHQTTVNKTLALDYLNAAGQKQLDKVAALLHPDVAFAGPFSTYNKALNYIAALQKLSVIVSHYAIKRIFAEDDEVCAIYDLVTDTPLGRVPCVEWLNIYDGQIISIQLIFDRYRWPEVMEEMGKRLAAK